MTPREEESDQLPEDQPSGAATQDTDESSRDEAEGSAGSDSRDEGQSGDSQATGNPANAGE